MVLEVGEVHVGPMTLEITQVSTAKMEDLEAPDNMDQAAAAAAAAAVEEHGFTRSATMSITERIAKSKAMINAKIA